MSIPTSLMSRAERVLLRADAPAARIAALVEDRLAEVETRFRDHLASPLAIVDEIGEFIAASGGKRVRPTLHLLAARACGYRGNHDVTLAVVLEFIHSATLVHDDIIDEATTRRGRPSVNFKWGNSLSVLFGDYLYAKAMQMALSVGSLEVMDRLADLTLRMTEGEMLQTRYAGRLDLTEEDYLALVERKTAALFGGCCELAGLLGEVDADRRQALKSYGLNLGIAFQLIDDLLDYTGDPRILGKAASSDLREGKATLPVIDLLASGSERGFELARAIVGGEDSTAASRELMRLLEDSGSLERTRQLARSYTDQALEALRPFPAGPSTEALAAIAQMVVDRRR